MTRAALLACLFLAACGDSRTPDSGAQPGASSGGTRAEAERAAETASGIEKIDCAVEGAAAYERVCLVERTSGAEGLVLTIRHPGGGFRRLQVTRDGRGVVPADGAESATVTILGDRLIEVAIAGERYKLPATVRK
jgi:hypothetical protein